MEFANNNTLNSDTGHIFIKLKYRYYLYISFEGDINLYSKFYLV